MGEVYVIGAGVMGTDIASALLAAGYHVTLVDAVAESLDRAAKKVADRIPRPAGVLSGTSVKECRPAGGSIVIEAITESMEAKSQLLRQISEYCDSTTSLYSNTSTLPITDLAKVVKHPEKFAGLHFFYPAHRNPFVEIIKAPLTSTATIEEATNLASQLGKHFIICRDRPGFVVNAFYLPLVNEAARLVDEELGSPSEIDSVARTTFGVKVGPLAVAAMMNPDTTRLTIKALVDQGACPPLAESIADGSASKFTILEVSPLDDQVREQQIKSRLLAAVFTPCLRMVRSGDASANDIEIAATQALQFKHGPYEIMKNMGGPEVQRITSLVQPDRN